LNVWTRELYGRGREKVGHTYALLHLHSLLVLLVVDDEHVVAGCVLGLHTYCTQLGTAALGN
jgi:hypothetical protein